MKWKRARLVFLTIFLLITSFLGFSQDPGKTRTKPRISPRIPSTVPFVHREKVVPFIQRTKDRATFYSAMPILVDPYPGYTGGIIVPPNSKHYTMRIVPSGMGSTNIIIRRRR